MYLPPKLTLWNAINLLSIDSNFLWQIEGLWHSRSTWIWIILEHSGILGKGIFSRVPKDKTYQFCPCHFYPITLEADIKKVGQRLEGRWYQRIPENSKLPFNSLRRRDGVFQHGGSLVSLDAQMFLGALLAHDDVDVAGDHLQDLFRLRRLDGVVLVAGGRRQMSGVLAKWKRNTFYKSFFEGMRKSWNNSVQGGVEECQTLTVG